MARRRAPENDASQWGDIFWPEQAAEPILARPVRGALMQWLTEIWAKDELAEVGLLPRRRAIFDGPPGVGKTTLAHHLSARLGLPMLAVRPDCIIDCWIGSTGRNIGGVFEAAAAGVARADGEDPSPLLLFLDEFDALAPKRGPSRQAADEERNAAVNTLLQRLEQYPGYLIAATNFSEHIDAAVWRRFDIHITLQLPGHRELCRILARYLDPYGLPRPVLEELARAFETASPALVRAFCEGLKRQMIIGPKLGEDMRRDAVIGRVIETVHPHPDLGKPRLWSLGPDDKAIAGLPWPLPRADEVASMEAAAPAEIPDKIVALSRVRRPR